MNTQNNIFHDPRRFEAEMRHLFFDEWTFVGTEDQLPKPETRFVYESWGRSIIVTRDTSGKLGAFVNACPHRGTRLCRPERPGAGNIQCPYHGWVFDGDGKLLGASKRAGLPPFDNADLGLTPLAVDRVEKFIFVCGRRNPPPLREFLGERAHTLVDLNRSAVSPLFEIRAEIQGDWKLVVSGAIEDYHVPFVHRSTLNPKRQGAAYPSLLPRGHSSFVTPAPMGRVLRGVARWLYGGVEPRETLENHLIFPNFLLVRVVGVVHVTQFIPLGPGRTLRVSRLFDSSPKRKLWDPKRWLRAALASIGKRGVAQVYEEDLRIVEEAHRGTLAGRRLHRGPAHAEEIRVEHFLREVEERLRRPSTRSDRDELISHEPAGPARG